MRSGEPLSGFFGLCPVKREERHVPSVYFFSDFLEEWAMVSGGTDGEGAGWQVKMRRLIDSLPFVQWGGGGTYVERAKSVLFLLRLVESDFWAVRLEKDRALTAVSRLLKFKGADELEKVLGGFCDLRFEQPLGALLALLDRSRFWGHPMGNEHAGAQVQIRRFIVNCYALSRIASNESAPLDGRIERDLARLRYNLGENFAPHHELICRILLESQEHDLLLKSRDEVAATAAAYLAAEALDLNEVDAEGFVKKVLSCQQNRDAEAARLNGSCSREVISRKGPAIWHLKFISRLHLERRLESWRTAR